MPVDISWMREAANMPQMPSYAEQQQARNALALQGMQLQEGKMKLEDAMRERQGLAQLQQALSEKGVNADPEEVMDMLAQHAAQTGDAATYQKAQEARLQIRKAKQADALFGAYSGGATGATPTSTVAAAPQSNMMAPATAPAAPANAMAAGPSLEQTRDLGMKLVQLGDPRGQQILQNLDRMFPQSKMGEMPELVKLQQYAAQLPPGSPDRRAIDARITELTSRAPRQPTEFEIALSMVPPEERTAAARSQLGLSKSTEVAQTITDETGRVRMFNKQGQEITPTAAAAPGQAPTPVEIKGKPSATFEKTRALRQQQAKDLDYAIKELESASVDGGLIDQSTGSGAGRAVDVSAEFFGKATPGSIAIGKLQPIADLVLKQIPRFEGPQSDKDTQSYKEAAGQLANGSLPNEIRKEAARTIIRLMKDRKEQFVSTEMAAEGLPAGRAAPAGNVDVDALLNKYK